MSDARELALENRIARVEADAKSWRRVAEGLQQEITRLKEELAGCNKALAISDTAHQKCRAMLNDNK